MHAQVNFGMTAAYLNNHICKYTQYKYVHIYIYIYVCIYIYVYIYMYVCIPVYT